VFPVFEAVIAAVSMMNNPMVANLVRLGFGSSREYFPFTYEDVSEFTTNLSGPAHVAANLDALERERAPWSPYRHRTWHSDFGKGGTRINDQWRIRFRWTQARPDPVENIDSRRRGQIWDVVSFFRSIPVKYCRMTSSANYPLTPTAN